MAVVTVQRSMGRVLADYVSLAKPRVVLLHLLTAGSAMFLAAGGIPQANTFWMTLAGGGLMASASNALNCYLDRDIDGLMPRTSRRPLPSGRLKSGQALLFGMISGFIGLLIFSYLANPAAGLLALMALAYYIVVYTLWLKRNSYWAAVVGSGAGALPPLVGWVAVTGEISITAILLVAIIMLWTLPHFWSLAIFRRREYEKVGIKVVPLKTALYWITASAFLLVITSIILIPIAGSGPVYSVAAVVAGFGMMFLTTKLVTSGNADDALHLFKYSIFYLLVLFASVIIDRLIS